MDWTRMASAILSAILGTTTTFAAEMPSVAKGLIEQHCVDCHGPTVQKADLRLDRLLSADRKTPAALTLWTKVFDRVHAGEMPPAKRERPDPAQLKSLLGWLQTELHEVSLERQKAEGRTSLRRLNRMEYENTVRSLLDVDVELKELLPEDASAGGFDNVGAALDVTGVHLVRYQQAAETALDAAIPVRPFTPLKRKMSADDSWLASKSLLVRAVDGAQIIHARNIRNALRVPQFPRDGSYRIRFAAYAVHTKGKPLTGMLTYTKPLSVADPECRAYFEVPPDKSTIAEVVVHMRRNENLQFTAWQLPTEATIGKKDVADLPGLALEWFEVEELETWPPRSYRHLFGDVPLSTQATLDAMQAKKKPPSFEKRGDNEWKKDPLIPASANPAADADRLIRAFLPRAFRRDVPQDVADAYVKLVQDRLENGYSFDAAMRVGFKAILCSPHFFYLREKTGKLDDFTLANRLAYFLWSTMPDDVLMQVARASKLREPAVLRAQVERMLDDPRASAFTKSFTGQWLDLRKLDDTVPDPSLYGEYDRYLLWSMQEETEKFFAEMLKQNRSVLEFVDSNWTFVNDRLAQHYSLPGTFGPLVRKTTLPADSHRGGVLTQASVLKVTANGTTTSPVVRGKWVLERIVGKSPPPPPPDIPSLEPDIRGAVTIREQLAKHRALASCASCHLHIDPPGFALENFDVIGGYRDFYRATKATKAGTLYLKNYPTRRVNRGPDVEQGYVTAKGQEFRTIEDYKKILLADGDQIARNVIRQVMTYATGAEVQFADRAVIEEIVGRLRSKNLGFRDVIHEVVHSRVFLHK